MNFYKIIFSLLVFDQLSKLYFLEYWPEMVFYNYGIAFSMQIPILIPIIIAILTVAGIISLINKKELQPKFYWALFVAGALGNTIDRIRLGKVIDFISIGNFPIFNLADVYITFSAIFIVYFLILKHDQRK